MQWVHTGINLTVKDKPAASEVQLLKYLQILTFLENKSWWQFSNQSPFSWAVDMSDVQENGQTELNISLFCSIYY